MKVEIKLPPEIESAQRRLRDDQGMFGSLVRVLDRENELTTADIVEKRLSFPKSGPAQSGGLRVRTGRLRRSIQPGKAVVIAGGVMSSIGSNVKYLGVHEFGFDGDVTVRPFMRKRKERQVIFGKKRVVRVGDVPVRSFKRHMSLPARAPIRKGINDRLDNYREAIRVGMIQFYSGK